MNTRLLLFLVALTSASTAAAAEPTVTERADDLPVFSLTFSPVHLALPMLEITGELRLGDRLGAAAIAGGGAFTGERLGDPGDDNTYSAFELGGQLRYYPLGSFRSGMQLGAELMYLSVDAEGAAGSARGEGLTAGPFVGYKHAWQVGLTLEAQIGAQLLLLRASSDSGASADDSRAGVLLNLNAGWSF